jgi:urease accessory protein
MSSSADARARDAGGRISIFEFENRDPTPVAAQPQRQGVAELTFVRRGGRTVLAHSRVTAPITLIRPFALAGGGQLVQLITLGPGLCGGDRVDLRITAEADADVVVTTTAATRVLSMRPDDRAEQHVVIAARAGATVQYYPLATIPFPDSAFAQTVRVEAAAGARVGVLETWAMGRTARGEYLRFRSLSNRTLLSVDGEIRYADATELYPREVDLSGAGLLAHRRYLASGFWYGATIADTPQQGAAEGDVLIAFATASPQIAYLRALATDAIALDGALSRATDVVAAAWQRPPVALTRFHN